MSRHDSLFGHYRPTGRAFERLPVGWKYAVVAALTVPPLVVRQWWLTALAFMLVTVLLVAAGLGRRGLRLPWGLLLLVSLMGLFQVIFGAWLDGVVLAGNVVVAVLASRLLTMTTPMPVLIDALVTAARPLRWMGLSPEQVGLAVAVMLRSVPFLVGAFSEVRDAARARGLERNPLAQVTPVVVRAVGYAQATGDALVARGLGDSDLRD